MRIYEITSSHQNNTASPAKKAKKIADATRKKSDAFHDYQAKMKSAKASASCAAASTSPQERRRRTDAVNAKQAEAKLKYERKRARADDAIRAALALK